MSGSGLVIGCFGWLWGGYWVVMGGYRLAMSGYGWFWWLSVVIGGHWWLRCFLLMMGWLWVAKGWLWVFLGCSGLVMSGNGWLYVVICGYWWLRVFFIDDGWS